ncbi:MAG: hypothetical protein JXR37_06835 [Kiritimatiellae bacterium]|nr:hypothetical protein [Kiritimatiellia bacterium]
MARSTDESHLNALSICYFVWAGLMFLFAWIPLVHVFMGLQIARGKLPFFFPVPAGKDGPEFDFPPQIGYVFVALGVFFICMGVTFAFLNLLAGFRLNSRKSRVFTIVIACLNCLQFPFGTALGVFTIVVLSRQSVVALYAQANAGGTGGAPPPVPGGG